MQKEIILKPDDNMAVPAPNITTLDIDVLYWSEKTASKTAEVENIATNAGPARICLESYSNRKSIG